MRPLCVKFSYWSKFHVNTITGSGVVAIIFNEGLTRNPKIGNTPVLACPISGGWGELEIPNLVRIEFVYSINHNA